MLIRKASEPMQKCSGQAPGPTGSLGCRRPRLPPGLRRAAGAHDGQPGSQLHRTPRTLGAWSAVRSDVAESQRRPECSLRIMQRLEEAKGRPAGGARPADHRLFYWSGRLAPPVLAPVRQHLSTGRGGRGSLSSYSSCTGSEGAPACTRVHSCSSMCRAGGPWHPGGPAPAGARPSTSGPPRVALLRARATAPPPGTWHG